MIRFPRTLHGWRKLFWISLGICPFHWAWLRATWQDRPNAFCFTCEGIGIFPDGFMAALRMNAYAIQQKNLCFCHDEHICEKYCGGPDKPKGVKL